ncbi:MAG: UDP-N-acetylmuramoyl-L-alanine--D-glutamate ligase [Clostridiales bacterium]|jgi:UDP-N-acetylmuramoylalanine--D-glutamate ligase|nr:UDP-N-acetylmuramoyl-L-alanine--D-glutamate ligase [Clostridiales bacterium]
MSDKFLNKNVLVLGSGVSGQGACKALYELGATPKLYDDFDDTAHFSASKIPVVSDFDMIILSPSILQRHPIVDYARQNNIYTIGEMELGYQICTSPIIAVTGTNGKTTVCSMLAKVLNSAGYKVCLAGNIGVPFSLAALNSDCDVTVLEVSSFQLLAIDKFAPHIAAITNISPDHLDMHDTMKNYVRAKFNITRNQNASDYLILANIDSKLLNGFNTKATVINMDECDSLDFDNNIKIVNQIAKIYRIKTDSITKTLKNFKPDRHRMEFVAKINNTVYINDSKATNIGATQYAIRQCDGTVALLLGGSDKGLQYDEIFVKLDEKVKSVFAFGQVAQKMKESAEKYGYQICICSSMQQAILKASALDVNFVLLSPAAASFDGFKDYKHRGEVFVEYVKSMSKL